MTSRHLIFVGTNFIPRRATGDKNFWAALIPSLAAGVDHLSVVSIRDEPVQRESIHVGSRDIDIRYVPPSIAGLGGRAWRGPGWLSWRGGSHPRILGQLNKLLILPRLVAELGDVMRGRPDSRVHLMDNFGLANHVLALATRRAGGRLSIAAIAYERRGRRLYDTFLRLSYRVRGARVVAYSRRLAERLHRLGVPASRLARIPWGVRSGVPESAEARIAARVRLGLPVTGSIVLWAGFIQQVREPDFWLAYRLAQAARKQQMDASFIFAFKPETFRPEYAACHRPLDGIHVLATPVATFADAMSSADILLSPIESRDCVVAPPLTWIEAMAAGVPVLTTDVAGAEELVDDGDTGFRATDETDLLAKLASLLVVSTSMSAACRAKVAADYDLDAIGRAYLDLWFGELS